MGGGVGKRKESPIGRHPRSFGSKRLPIQPGSSLRDVWKSQEHKIVRLVISELDSLLARDDGCGCNGVELGEQQ